METTAILRGVRLSAQKGRLVAEGTLTELRQQHGRADLSLEDLFIALVDIEAAAA